MMKNAGRMKPRPAAMAPQAPPRAWGVDQSKPFHEALLGDPLALLLNLGLHDAHDGRAAKAQGPDREERRTDLDERVTRRLALHPGPYSRGRVAGVCAVCRSTGSRATMASRAAR